MSRSDSSVVVAAAADVVVSVLGRWSEQWNMREREREMRG